LQIPNSTSILKQPFNQPQGFCLGLAASSQEDIFSWKGLKSVVNGNFKIPLFAEAPVPTLFG
jgi:hypothetical protein